jgi:hypothetical protein
VVLWNMHGGGVNKVEIRVQILELFQGADLVLLTETWHFPGQHLPHIERFDSFTLAHTVQLGTIKAIKHSGGVATYFRNEFNPNLLQWKEGSHDSYIWLRVNMDATLDLFVCGCMLPLLVPNTRTNPCSKTWQQILLKFKL